MTIITISRQFASGGDKIAHRLCETLGYRYFDKQAVAEVVAEGGLTVDEMMDYSEDDYRLRTFLDRVLGWRHLPTGRGPSGAGTARDVAPVGAAVAEAAGVPAAGAEVATAIPRSPARRNPRPEGAELNENMLIWLVHAAIQAVYKQGNAVIVGRGGQAILREQPGVLHVRIEAPFETRVRELEERENITYAAAREAIQRHDRQAAEYLKRFYGVEWSDPTLYHMILNTGYWDIDGAVQVIAHAAGCVPQAAPAE